MTNFMTMMTWTIFYKKKTEIKKIDKKNFKN